MWEKIFKGKNKRTIEDNIPAIGGPTKKQRILPPEIETEKSDFKLDCNEFGVSSEEDARYDASISTDGTTSEVPKQRQTSYFFRSDLIEGDESRTITLYGPNSDDLDSLNDQVGSPVPIREPFSDITSLSCQVFNVNIYTQLPTAETI